MAVTSNGTPALVNVGTPSNAMTVTGSFPTGSSPAAGDLIVCVVSLYGSSTAASVTQNTGTTGYSNPVTITGTNFGSVLSVVFGTTAGTVVSSSPTSIVVTTPPHAIGAVTVTFDAGYGAASAVPEGIKSWIKLRVGSLYAHREEVAVVSRGRVELLPFIDGLLDPYKVAFL